MHTPRFSPLYYLSWLAMAALTTAWVVPGWAGSSGSLMIGGVIAPTSTIGFAAFGPVRGGTRAPAGEVAVEIDGTIELGSFVSRSNVGAGTLVELESDRDGGFMMSAATADGQDHARGPQLTLLPDPRPRMLRAQRLAPQAPTPRKRETLKLSVTAL